jgi:hypothetical protein
MFREQHGFNGSARGYEWESAWDHAKVPLGKIFPKEASTSFRSLCRNNGYKSAAKSRLYFRSFATLIFLRVLNNTKGFNPKVAQTEVMGDGDGIADGQGNEERVDEGRVGF